MVVERGFRQLTAPGTGVVVTRFTTMILEHFAFNVSDARAMARWYGEHLGLRVVRDVGGAADTLFLGDDTGRVVMEIYNNRSAPVPAYPATHPLCFHFAFVAPDAAAERQRLEAAGATLVEEVRPADGSLLIMLRDPWGVPVQLCQRAHPFGSSPEPASVPR